MQIYGLIKFLFDILCTDNYNWGIKQISSTQNWISRLSVEYITILNSKVSRLTNIFWVKFCLRCNKINSISLTYPKVVFTCLLVKMVEIRFLHFHVYIQHSAGVNVHGEIRFLVFCFYFILVYIITIRVIRVGVGSIFFRVILNKIITFY